VGTTAGFKLVLDMDYEWLEEELSDD